MADAISCHRRSAISAIDLLYVAGVRGARAALDDRHRSATEGLAWACKLALKPVTRGVDWLLAQDEKPRFRCPERATSAYVHRTPRRRYAEAGIRRHRPDPGALGPRGDPARQPARAPRRAERQHGHLRRAAATIPMVYAGSARRRRSYADRIVASVPSVSCAGPGTRANIDEFTQAPPAGVARHRRGQATAKAIIILNPAEPPMIMRDTISLRHTEDADHARDHRSRSKDVVAEVQTYVPATRLLNEPQFDEPSVIGRGNRRSPRSWKSRAPVTSLPPWRGNLDIMTAAATKVGEEIAKNAGRLGRGGPEAARHFLQPRVDVRMTDTSGGATVAPQRHRFTKDEVGAIVAPHAPPGVPVIEVTHGDGLGGSASTTGAQDPGAGADQAGRRDGQGSARSPS